MVERVTCNHKVLSSILNEGWVEISLWECSSNGRALALHARGKGIDALLFQIFYKKHLWCSGNMVDFHSTAPGSIPGRCNGI